MGKNIRNEVLLVAVVGFLACCDSNSTDIQSIALPDPVNASDFSANVASPNPFFPLVVGQVRRSEGQTPEGTESIVEEVTDRTKVILGVTTTVVRARAYLDGELIEDTDDWYAQDKDGNVWYLGEYVKNYENGVLVDNAGSWEAGVNGARAGIIMWAEPKTGSVYYQEYYKGEAEDVGEVLALNETVTVPYGTFNGCLKTEDTTALEPDQVEHKYYCPGIGQVLEVNIGENFRIELMELEN